MPPSLSKSNHHEGRSWRRSWTRTNCPAGLACHGLDATAGLPAVPTSLRPERAAVTHRTIWPSWCSAVQEGDVTLVDERTAGTWAATAGSVPAVGSFTGVGAALNSRHGTVGRAGARRSKRRRPRFAHRPPGHASSRATRCHHSRPRSLFLHVLHVLRDLRVTNLLRTTPPHANALQSCAPDHLAELVLGGPRGPCLAAQRNHPAHAFSRATHCSFLIPDSYSLIPAP